MWLNKPTHNAVKRRPNLSFMILNGYENINRNIFFHSRKIVELEETR